MIDPNKQYRTRDGRPVRIYATDGAGNRPVHGAVMSDGGWWYHEWSLYGESRPFTTLNESLDLIEVTLADELTKQVPWEALRPEIEWVAMTSYGDWLGSDRKPKIVTELNMERWMPLLMTLAAVAMPDVNREQWRETLCKRPEGT